MLTKTSDDIPLSGLQKLGPEILEGAKKERVLR